MSLAVDSSRPLTSMGLPLEIMPSTFGELRRSNEVRDDVASLRRRLAEDGYLFVPGLLPQAEVVSARNDVLARLEREGHLEPGTPRDEARARPGSREYLFRPDLTRENRALQQLLYRPEGDMMRFFGGLLGGPVRHYDYTWLRCVGPGKGTPPHCDVVYMGRGTKNVLTAWTPLGDADLDLGGLMVLEGSHTNERLRSGYGSRDVDTYCEDDPNDPARTANGRNGWLSEDPVRLRRGFDTRWLTAEFRAGDLLIFNLYLVHGSLDNRTDRFRLSADSRYQLAAEPIDDRWIGADPPGHGPAGKRGRIC